LKTGTGSRHLVPSRADAGIRRPVRSHDGALLGRRRRVRERVNVGGSWVFTYDAGHVCRFRRSVVTGESAVDLTGAPVRAAGGVLVRKTWSGGLEVVLIYRSTHDDWSFPKGKLEAGETELFCARREVEEETGLLCNIGDYVGHTEYTDRHGRHKTVRYWLMEPTEGEFVPTDEVAAMEWVPVGSAKGILTYEHDRTLLENNVMPVLAARFVAPSA
jgi:8-oxo-dGTP diphosphatase